MISLVGLSLTKNRLLTEEKLLLVGLIIASIFLITIGISRITYPFDIGCYEACVWAPAQLAASGINPYSIMLSKIPPYIMAPYGIVYYGIVGLGIKIAGVQFWIARLLSLFCILISTLAVFKLTIHFTANKKTAQLSALLFLSQFTIQSWIGVQRPDFFALTLSLSGITIALIDESKRIWKVVFASVLLVLSVLTRQTTIIPIIIIALWYIINKDYSKFFGFSGITVLLLGLIMYLLNTSSKGGYILQEFIIQSGVKKSIALALNHLAVFLQPVSFLTMILGILIVCNKNNFTSEKISSHKKNRLQHYCFILLVYFILSFLMAFITASRYGSNINYYIEVFTVSSLLVPIYLKKIKKRLEKYYKYILIFFILSLSFQGIRICRGEIFRWKALPYYEEIVTTIKAKTRPQQPIYSDYPELAAFAGRPYYFNDFCQYDGRSQEQNLLFDSIQKSMTFSAIITAGENSPMGYYQFPLSVPKPYKYYTVHLFLKK